MRTGPVACRRCELRSVADFERYVACRAGMAVELERVSPEQNGSSNLVSIRQPSQQYQSTGGQLRNPKVDQVAGWRESPGRSTEVFGSEGRRCFPELALTKAGEDKNRDCALELLEEPFGRPGQMREPRASANTVSAGLTLTSEPLGSIVDLSKACCRQWRDECERTLVRRDTLAAGREVGEARAEPLSADRQLEIARQAASARWRANSLATLGWRI